MENRISNHSNAVMPKPFLVNLLELKFVLASAKTWQEPNCIGMWHENTLKSNYHSSFDFIDNIDKQIL